MDALVLMHLSSVMYVLQNVCVYILYIYVYIHTYIVYMASSSLLRQMIPRRQQEQLCSLFRKCSAKRFFLRHSQVNESPFRKFLSNILAVLTLSPGTASGHKLSI